MIKKVLVVDDDQQVLRSLMKGLEAYMNDFAVVTAPNGLIAIEKLKSEPVSLVVTDLNMPHMNGFSLLSHVMEHYPDIPVIVITAYGADELENRARRGGAVGYIEKPFRIEDLARKIISTLRKETEGGTLHGVSSGTFLQLIEMEEKTCTIRVSNKASDKKGVLFFRDGQLLDARINGLEGEEAAHQIFSWDEVSIAIQNGCLKKEKSIKGDLKAVLIQAMRLKDEAGAEEILAAEGERGAFVEIPEEEIETLEPEEVGPAETLWMRVEKEIRERGGLEDIYKDSAWDGILAEFERIGSFFGAGGFRGGFLSDRGSRSYILFPGEMTTVIAVNSKCPKERILEILSE